MRIVSKFRDYYDIGQSLGQDQSILYVREERVIETGPPKPSYGGLATRFIVGFCGNFYVGFRFYHDGNHFYHYSMEDCERFVSTLSDTRDQARFNQILLKGRRTWFDDAYAFRWNLRVHFGVPDHLKEDVFHEHKSPIILWEGDHKVVVNPMLRPYEFYRIKDPYTAFQEVQQFVGGTLTNASMSLPKMSDEDMQNIKGFDHKYSFRKEPK